MPKCVCRVVVVWWSSSRLCGEDVSGFPGFHPRLPFKPGRCALASLTKTATTTTLPRIRRRTRRRTIFDPAPQMTQPISARASTATRRHEALACSCFRLLPIAPCWAHCPLLSALGACLLEPFASAHAASGCSCHCQPSTAALAVPAHHSPPNVAAATSRACPARPARLP